MTVELELDTLSLLIAIPEDPTILSGTLRSTLDVFNEYQDAEIVCMFFINTKTLLTVLLV